MLCVIVFILGFASLTAVFFTNKNLTTFAYKHIWKVNEEKVRALEEVDKQIVDTDNLIKEADEYINSTLITLNGVDILKDLSHVDRIVIADDTKEYFYDFAEENKFVYENKIFSDSTVSFKEQLDKYCPTNLNVKEISLRKSFETTLKDYKNFYIDFDLKFSEELKVEFNNFLNNKKIEDFSAITEMDYKVTAKVTIELNSESTELTKIVFENYLTEVAE